jgi:MFS family permease
MEEKPISTPADTSGTQSGESLVSTVDVVDSESTNATKKRKSWRFWVALAFLFVCAFISSIDATILGTALPLIAEDLQGTSVLTFWSATSFILAKTVVQPGKSPNRVADFLVWGSLSEVFGRKNVLLYVIIVFLTGSIISARSMSMEMLVAGRTVQGMGGGGLITLVEVAMTDMIPLAERGVYWSMLAFVWLVGSVIGRALF